MGEGGKVIIRVHWITGGRGAEGQGGPKNIIKFFNCTISKYLTQGIKKKKKYGKNHNSEFL